MASDLSSGCTEVIEIFDEKEEGEISLEDVSSSEEGQLNDGCNCRRRAAGQCPSCLSTNHCASWCGMPSRKCHTKSLTKKDAVQEKENCHHTKDSGYSGSKHSVSTLQENNNDLIPISSDSDMEIVGLTDSVKPPLALPLAKTTKVRTHRRKRRSKNSSTTVENVPILNPSNIMTPESSHGPKRNTQILKDNHLPRAHWRESNSPHTLAGVPFSRSRMTKSPLRRHKSPFGRARSPVVRKSPNRKPRSSGRRSPISPISSPTRRQLRNSLSPCNPSVNIDGTVNKLLKKVRQLKTIGTHSSNPNFGRRRGREPSLKDKLNNMIRSTDDGDNQGNDITSTNKSETKVTENVDDEEDLALLRKMALETKPKWNDKAAKAAVRVKEDTQMANNNVGDDDVEDLELRMIALRSAMLKKHQDRMQRGMMPGKTKNPTTLARTESPFNQSFLDSIPIPGENNEDEFKAPLHTPIQLLNENTNPEDMELDSEVELEKEKGVEPYSPTDDVSHQINIDSELLGIKPSDVSFITPTSQVTVLSSTCSLLTPESEKIEILELRASYLPSNETSMNHHLLSSESTYYPNTNVLPSSQSPTSSIYSPTHITETLENHFSTQSDDNPAATPYSPSQPIDTSSIYLSPQSDPFFTSDPNQISDTPYSPTDTPMYDLESNNPSLLLNTPLFQVSDMIDTDVDILSREKDSKTWKKVKPESALVKMKLGPNVPKDINKSLDNNIVEPSSLSSELSSPLYLETLITEMDHISETSSMRAEVGSALNSSGDSADSTMIVVDDLPATDLDGSPLIPASREIQDIEIHIPAISSEETPRVVQEPLYLQGVPDITKDANKIPTSVNRSLVPASILKSNKNLQQPLPPKKVETHLEPTFKSAEMQPVQISTETTKINPLFKPIKLAPVTKKPQLRMVTPAAFNCSSNDNSVLEEQKEYESIKPGQRVSKNEAGNLLDLQNKHALQFPSKTLETSNVLQSENGTRIEQSMKTLLLPKPQTRMNLVQDQDKTADTFEVANRKPMEIVEENSDIRKKTRSRKSKSDNRRSSQVPKTARYDENIEMKNPIANTFKATLIDGTTLTDACLVYKQASNSTEMNKNHGPENAVKKKRNSKDRWKKPEPENRKRDRGDRRNRRSEQKCKKLSNDSKKIDVNKLDDQNVPMKERQQKITEVEEGTKHPSQSALISAQHLGNCVSEDYSMDVMYKDDSGIIQDSGPTLNVHTNMANDGMSDSQKLSKSNNPNVDISNDPASCNAKTKSVENSPSVLDISTENAEDSPSNIRACKKVEVSKRRRSSLEDDEEALRAILLASLAKRSKPPDFMNSVSTKATTLTNLSHNSGNTRTESVESLLNTPTTKVPVNLVHSSSSETTPVSLGNNPSAPSHFSDKKSKLGSLPQIKTSNIPITKNIVSNNTTQYQTTALIAPSRKKPTSTNAKAPLKKIARKAPISASTKVVNNAKKYQNTLVQKKLNLQKIATITNAQKTLNLTNLHSNKVIDGSRPRSMITQPLSEIQRFVINLASDSESENETETLHRNLGESTNINRSELKPALAIPMSDFEKSVDLFLKDVRKKQETAASIKPSLTTAGIMQKPISSVTSVHRKSPILSTTPLAVRHLPVSLQEEYRRLKQQILERERLKLHRVLINNTSPSSPSSKSSGTPPGPLSPASPIASPIISRKNHNTISSSQSRIDITAKDNSLRSVSIQNNIKNITSSITTRASPIISKANAPISSVSTLNIRIPNETVNVNSSPKKSSDPYIPVSTSQTRLVAAVKITQNAENTKESKNSAVLIKDQINLKNVHIELQQGTTGRRVSLGETLSLNTKPVISKDNEVEAQDSSPINASVNVDSNCTGKNTPMGISSSSLLANPTKPIDSVDIWEKCVNSVDSSASTLIISKEEENVQYSSSLDSSVCTVIIPRNENADSRKLVFVSPESSKVTSPTSKSAIIAPKKLRNNMETWEKIRGDVRKELDAISALPSSDQKSYLATVEQNLVKKRYAILDDLSEISGNLRQLEMEREVQSNMALEVKKLQEQLKIAEERLQAQRIRVNKMIPNITATYEKFNSGRRECVKMTKICLGLGCIVIGANYKIPAAGAQLLNNRLKQVAGCTRQLSSKKMSISMNADETQSKIELRGQVNSIEDYLHSTPSESTPSTVYVNSTPEGDGSVTISSVTLMNDPKISNNEFAASVEAEQTDTAEQESLKFGETTTAFLAGNGPQDSPQLTSTPNSSKESSNIIMHIEDLGTRISNFVLDIPGVDFSGKDDRLELQRFLQPYKSVLTHLSVPRTTDPNGILCPYELMGTCRDEDCQFVHQSARNG